jgi:hypothetical protein
MAGKNRACHFLDNVWKKPFHPTISFYQREMMKRFVWTTRPGRIALLAAGTFFV